MYKYFSLKSFSFSHPNLEKLLIIIEFYNLFPFSFMIYNISVLNGRNRITSFINAEFLSNCHFWKSIETNCKITKREKKKQQTVNEILIFFHSLAHDQINFLHFNFDSVLKSIRIKWHNGTNLTLVIFAKRQFHSDKFALRLFQIYSLKAKKVIMINDTI